MRCFNRTSKEAADDKSSVFRQVAGNNAATLSTSVLIDGWCGCPSTASRPRQCGGCEAIMRVLSTAGAVHLEGKHYHLRCAIERLYTALKAPENTPRLIFDSNFFDEKDFVEVESHGGIDLE